MTAFFGREKETRRLVESLSAGRNVILSGTYGIGRTSLVRHVARVMQGRRTFLFADFSDTPDRVCREVERRLTAGTLYRKKAAAVHYKSRRRRLAATAANSGEPHVLVLDNIAKLTAQKLNLVRFWVSAGAFQFVAVTEAFLAEDELRALRLALLPADMMRIGRLPMQEAMEMIRARAAGRCPPLSEEALKAVASAARGYPLGIVELMPMPGAAGTLRRTARRDTAVGEGPSDA
ncbi:MAG: AAA family ATPase [Syntrophaceae bacterium]|nr:AAA family ATPase [Syntrophaceae bacterium]